VLKRTRLTVSKIIPIRSTTGSYREKIEISKAEDEGTSNSISFPQQAVTDRY